MRKLFRTALSIISISFLVSCNGNIPGETSDEFKPSLNTNTECEITIVGSYDNFEALEAEFDRFNVYYPNVSLTYEKIDDYNNVIGSVLEREEKPNIFFSYTWMMGNSKYDLVIDHMENLSDSSLKFK